MAKILMVVTGADSLTLRDGTEHPTGYWAEELVESHRRFREAGLELDIATPGGVEPTVDPVSLDPEVVGDEEKARELADYIRSISDELASPRVLAEVDVADYDAVVLPGGHGPMADLAFDGDMGRLLVEADRRGLVIAPYCHGPAALLSATDDDGDFAFAGRTLTVFTDQEELQGGTGKNTPWFLEERLRKRGARVESGTPWESHVVVDGNLISGQNPASSADVADRVLSTLGVAAG